MANNNGAREKVALVTGAARGIGAAAAQRLAATGTTVYVSDLLDCEPVAAAIRTAGGTAVASRLDITDAASCDAWVEQIAEQSGSIDALVCNAGVCPAGVPANNREQWESVLNINLRGTQNCVDAVWETMTEQGHGNLVIVSSMAYYQGGLIVGTEYTASKAALIGMTRHLARNGGPLGIRVNAVAPGIIETDMTENFSKPDTAQIPLRRYGTADDVAGPIAFLVSDDSAYMTGTVLNITGGMVLAA